VTTASAPGVDVHVLGDGCEVWLRDAQGGTRRLAAFPAPGGVLAVRLASGGAAVAVPPFGGREARLVRYDAAGTPSGEGALPAGPSALVALPGGAVAVATVDGRALVQRADAAAPTEVARFAHAVTGLALVDGRLRVTGDDRAPRPLAEGEPAPPDATVVEGALGRYAFPRSPIVRVVDVDLDR
jgi:hypothetical protein